MRPFAIAAMLLLGACCGSTSTSTPEPTPAPTETPHVQVLNDLVLGAPPVFVHVPSAPRQAFTVDPAGEYRIDVTSDGAPGVQLRLFAGERVVVQAGDGTTNDAHVLTFLDAGSYEISVSEWRGRALDAYVALTRLPPMTPVAEITPNGDAVTVQAPAAETPRDASVEVTLVIARAGTYVLDVAAADPSRDAELTLLAHGGLVASDSDSGDESDAQLVRALDAGTYTLRVRDWRNRDASLSVRATSR